MKILAEYNGERVFIVNIRDNGTCDIVKTVYDEKTESDFGKLLLVNKQYLKIVDKDFIVDSLKEHIRQVGRDYAKRQEEELNEHEKAVLKSIANANKSERAKKDIY